MEVEELKMVRFSLQVTRKYKIRYECRDNFDMCRTVTVDKLNKGC